MIVLSFLIILWNLQTGICYRRVSDSLPSPAAVVGLLQSNGITRDRLFDTDPGVLRSFAGSEIELMIGVPNEDLPSLANIAVEISLQWLTGNIFAHISPDQIWYIAVGNEVFVKDPYYTPFVVPAIINLHRALRSQNLHEQIKLSTPHAACVLQSSFPPSNGSFIPDLQPSMAALLRFLLVTRLCDLGDDSVCSVGWALRGWVLRGSNLAVAWTGLLNVRSTCFIFY